MNRLAIVVIAAALTWACDGSRSPTSPTTAPPAAPAAPPAVPAATYTLSGVVSEMTPAGPAPVEGVKVEEARSFRSATTDANGFYSIAGVPAASTTVSTSKWGYDARAASVTIGGDTRVDIQIVRSAIYTLSGVVFEETSDGRAVVEGVEVYCDSCGEHGHTGTYTDADGFYTFSGVYAGVTPLLLHKDGYTDPPGELTRPLGDRLRRNPVVSGDTRFDIQIARR